MLLMIGYTGETDLQTISLISDRGWSIYLSTFGDADPTYIGKQCPEPFTVATKIKRSKISG